MALAETTATASRRSGSDKPERDDSAVRVPRQPAFAGYGPGAGQLIAACPETAALQAPLPGLACALRGIHCRRQAVCQATLHLQMPQAPAEANLTAAGAGRALAHPMHAGFAEGRRRALA